MISFVNDYSEGACEEILERLAATNHEQSAGYGLDPYCERAAEKIRQAIECDDCDVHFLVGGTQCNKTVIAAALRPHEAVICAESGHINVHESGAIENSGHKVLYAPSADGRLQCADVEAILAKHTDEHMVKPAMVYVSDATEIGTFYTYAQLKALSECCHAHGLYLFLDGARLGNALCAEGNDLTLPQLAQLCDVFYIGGTKNGALFGEALVIVNDALKPDFRYQSDLPDPSRCVARSAAGTFCDRRLGTGGCDAYGRAHRHIVGYAGSSGRGTVQSAARIYAINKKRDHRHRCARCAQPRIPAFFMRAKRS